MSAIDLSAVRAVEVADVLKAGRRAAQLRRTRAGVEFAYVDDYDGPPVATTLPLGMPPRLTPAGAVPPFFAGLLPEGRRLSSLRRMVKTSADDELSLLVAVGADTIGDVIVVPEGAPLTRATPVVVTDRSFGGVTFAALLAEVGIVDRVGLPGVQDKVSAAVISVPVDAADSPCILKLDPPEYPHVVENEAYFLRVARRCGLETVEAEVVHDTDGRPGLLVRRFDRVATGSGLVSLACEDACQLLDRWPADKYTVTGESVVRAVADVCAAGVVAARDVFRQLCFAWLTGNGDVHAKNVSVLRVAGEWRVSPAYDLPSTLPYGDRTLALPMVGTTSGCSRKKLVAFAAAVGIPERAALRVIDDVLDGTASVVDELRSGALPFDAATTAAMVKVLRYRRRVTTAG